MKVIGTCTGSHPRHGHEKTQTGSVVWDEKDHRIKETNWKAHPLVILSIEESTVTTHREMVPIDKIGIEFFCTREECYAAFDKPLRIDGPIIHTVPDRKSVGHAFTDDFLIPREGTQLLVGFPYECNLPNSEFFGDSDAVTLKEIGDKYSGDKVLTVMHEGSGSGEIFQLTANRPYWVLYGVTDGIAV